MKIKMHREILGLTDGRVLIDHCNFDTLDNRRTNLRVCTFLENARHRRKRRNSAALFKGVPVNNSRWKAMIRTQRGQIYLGTFQTQEEAALAYNKAAKETYGEFALLNEVK
jgi:hypothetical protein